MYRLLLLAALAALAAPVLAQAPRTIAYQGVLEDGGAPVTATTDLTFRLFDAATGGAALWTETQPVTPASDGAFGVHLGAVTALDGVVFDAPLWLEVSTPSGGGTTTLGPRTALAAAPYALGLYGVRVTPPTVPGFGPSFAAGRATNTASGDGAVVAGGGYDDGTNVNLNSASGLSSVVSGGAGNSASDQSSTVAGGLGNSASSAFATASGGQNNLASAQSSTVGGGFNNTATAFHATVGGGRDNVASFTNTTIGGGIGNSATNSYATVGGGSGNSASSNGTTVGGGGSNTAGLSFATVGGGASNSASGFYTTVGGGERNTASGSRATVPGGRRNEARGTHSFAAGYYARAAHNGTFVWSDDSQGSADSLVSTGPDQFLVRAAGGVGLNTNAPLAQLHVETADIGLSAAALFNEDLVAESPDAVVGLYSGAGGAWGSAVTLGEISTSGALTSKWAMVRETDAAGGSLYFTYKSGTGSENYAANFPKVRFDPNGSVHGGTYFSSGADFAEWMPLHDAGARLAPGQLVGVTGGRVGLATGEAEQVMIVSSDPALVGNPDAEAGGALVALVGQAEVHVAGGAAVGDLLVASGRGDGAARAVPPALYSPAADGPVAGRVLSAEGGRVVALVGVDQAAALRAVVVRQGAALDAQQRQLDAVRADRGRQQAQIDALVRRLDALDRRPAPTVSATSASR